MPSCAISCSTTTDIMKGSFSKKRPAGIGHHGMHTPSPQDYSLLASRTRLLTSLIGHHAKLNMVPTPATIKSNWRAVHKGSGMSKYLAAHVALFHARGQCSPLRTVDGVRQVLCDLPDLYKQVLNILKDANGQPADPRQVDLSEFLEEIVPRSRPAHRH